MFDYKLLAALAAVVEQGGFERAAQVLGLSQSAVSQRIKLLEARVGQPVLVRETPPSATEVGRRLLNHVQQVRLLERDLQAQVPALDEGAAPERLRIALNADSLATWLAPALARFEGNARQGVTRLDDVGAWLSLWRGRSIAGRRWRRDMGDGRPSDGLTVFHRGRGLGRLTTGQHHHRNKTDGSKPSTRRESHHGERSIDKWAGFGASEVAGRTLRYRPCTSPPR